MKYPWMPFYVGDYIANTRHLTTLQHGAYLLLLMHYWVHGGLPTDEKKLAAIAQLTHQQWLNNCLTIVEFFDKGWKHPRLEKELARAKNISEQRSLAGLKSAWNKRDKRLTLVEQLPPQSQSQRQSLERLRGQPKKER